MATGFGPEGLAYGGERVTTAQRGSTAAVDASSDDVQEAFRRGIGGASASTGDATPDDSAVPAPRGRNEALLLTLGRMPGLSNTRAAYETGRALRMIIGLFDRAGAPESVGRQFIDNLGAAVMTDHLRKRPLPWGAADTAEMFVEMYARILGASPAELDQVRRTVIDYAVADQRTKGSTSGGLAALFRRRRDAGAG
jgi:hypothetical protein